MDTLRTYETKDVLIRAIEDQEKDTFFLSVECLKPRRQTLLEFHNESRLNKAFNMFVLN